MKIYPEIKPIVEEIGTSTADSIRPILFADLSSFMSGKVGALTIILSELKPNVILKWFSFMKNDKKYASNQDTLNALSARFSSNSTLTSLYRQINKLKSNTVQSPDENKSRESEIQRLLNRASRFILSKLTIEERNMMKEFDKDLKIPSLNVIKTLNQTLQTSVAPPPPEEPKEAPKEKPKEAPKEKPTEKPKEAPKEAPKEKPKEAPKEAPKEKPKEAPKEAPKEKPKEAPKEAPKESDDSDDGVETKKSTKTKSESFLRNTVKRLVKEVLDSVEESSVLDDLDIDWRKTSAIVGGANASPTYKLPNGVTIDTNKKIVSCSDYRIVNQIKLLIRKKVILPIGVKIGKGIVLKYNPKVEDDLATVLSDLK